MIRHKTFASPLDQSVQRLVTSAARQVEEALAACAQAHRAETASIRRVGVVQHDLARALGLLKSVRLAREPRQVEADLVELVRAAVVACDQADSSRVAAVRRDLERALAALKDVRQAGPPEESSRRVRQAPLASPPPGELLDVDDVNIEGDV